MKRSLHIGINDYPGTGSDLSGCVNDANDWRETMEARDFEATSLLDGEATKSNMLEAISKIVADTGRDDIAVITYNKTRMTIEKVGIVNGGKVMIVTREIIPDIVKFMTGYCLASVITGLTKKIPCIPCYTGDYQCIRR